MRSRERQSRFAQPADPRRGRLAHALAAAAVALGVGAAVAAAQACPADCGAGWHSTAFELSSPFDSLSSGSADTCRDDCAGAKKGYRFYEFHSAFTTDIAGGLLLQECRCFAQPCNATSLAPVRDRPGFTVTVWHGSLCAPQCPAPTECARPAENALWHSTDAACQTQVAATLAECKQQCPEGAKYYEFWPASARCVCCPSCDPSHLEWTAYAEEPGLQSGALCSSSTAASFQKHRAVFFAGSLTEDPHFVGAHGTRYDFNGQLARTFCLVSDTALHLNGFFKGYRTAATVGASKTADGKALRSWIGELGLLWRDSQGELHSLHLVARRGKETRRAFGYLEAAFVDGRRVGIPQQRATFIRSGDLSLTFLGTSKKGEWDQDTFRLVLGSVLDVRLDLYPASREFQLPNRDAEVHFNVKVLRLAASRAVHGVLGQTFRTSAAQLYKAAKYSALSRLMGEPIQADGASGFGFLDGEMPDYISSGVLKADCKFAAFD